MREGIDWRLVKCFLRTMVESVYLHEWHPFEPCRSRTLFVVVRLFAFVFLIPVLLFVFLFPFFILHSFY
ncbi:hypothetical protein K450DRAFT_241046 [Umbelopsis ramanniana AG]|uniref:Transmembrane protein n=1 Tax=Umbelopsis ramanniana AG TaxID=1314678 RepID=A0AAD5E937_UMBRA|nr:uncharacterized protein K450DRAFT_241046 [Umbelopsis ramanniana AG]KAI8579688.1 hypothetical protein K450DRAFT_241046 [Umbelopsis ramanniana AG]